VKKLFIVLILGLVVAGCGDDEFDDTELINDLSGNWYIETCYIGLITVDDNYSRIVPVTYPDYLVSITPKGKVSIYLTTEAGTELISSGTVSGIAKNKLLFDKEISSTFKTIGFFEADNHREYSIIRSTGTSLEINYTFQNSSGKPQDEGFMMYQLGIY
jgi:hypothetical protein